MPGIYIASKAIHRPKWRELRDNYEVPIISRWIDVEDGLPDSAIDFDELWDNCLEDVARCDVLIAVAQPDERLKGVILEIGAALSAGKRVLLYGDPGRDNGTWPQYRHIERRMISANVDDIFTHLQGVRVIG
jgi:hypothetical protein